MCKTGEGWKWLYFLEKCMIWFGLGVGSNWFVSC